MHTLVTGNLQNLSYAYDSVGNITSIADSINSQTQSFDYDALDRLTSASANGEPGQGAYDETYQYDPATGNLKVKGDMTLDYFDSSHVHAVTNANGNTYSYDDNGNQTTRHIGNDTFHLIYDAENRLVEVKENNVTIAEFTFDGDGKRVMSVIDGETIRFVGGYYERKGSEITKYYMAGAARVAMRKYTIPQSMTVEYILGDHLGSTSITTDSNGAMVSELRYKPWGELRYTWTDASASTSPAYELTRYQYTGQYSYDVEFGLKYYGARFYDSAVGRFVSADTVIPGGTQGYDRYAYVYNNPLRYNDPTGHCPLCLVGMLVIMAFVLTADTPVASPPPTNYPANVYGGEGCSSSLPGCFGDVVVLKDFSGHGEDNPIPIEEFNEFADEVAEDLNSHDLTWPGISAGRQAYDTPFYNGGESERRTGDPNAQAGFYPADQQVCIETLRCSGRSEINYIAQGMWGAAVGEPKPITISITIGWKGWEYFDWPSEDTFFWLQYGYDYYQQWLEEQEAE